MTTPSAKRRKMSGVLGSILTVLIGAMAAQPSGRLLSWMNMELPITGWATSLIAITFCVIAMATIGLAFAAAFGIACIAHPKTE